MKIGAINSYSSINFDALKTTQKDLELILPKEYLMHTRFQLPEVVKESNLNSLADAIGAAKNNKQYDVVLEARANPDDTFATVFHIVKNKTGDKTHVSGYFDCIDGCAMADGIPPDKIVEALKQAEEFRNPLDDAIQRVFDAVA